MQSGPRSRRRQAHRPNLTVLTYHPCSRGARQTARASSRVRAERTSRRRGGTLLFLLGWWGDIAVAIAKIIIVSSWRRDTSWCPLVVSGSPPGSSAQQRLDPRLGNYQARRLHPRLSNYRFRPAQQLPVLTKSKPVYSLSNMYQLQNWNNLLNL